jgi:hypothetical protein
MSLEGSPAAIGAQGDENGRLRLPFPGARPSGAGRAPVNVSLISAMLRCGRTRRILGVGPPSKSAAGEDASVCGGDLARRCLPGVNRVEGTEAGAGRS